MQRTVGSHYSVTICSYVKMFNEDFMDNFSNFLNFKEIFFVLCFCF